MVALRETHKKTFDFNEWSKKLDLPAAQKDQLSKAHEYAVLCYCAKEKNEHLPESLVTLSNRSAEIVSILMTLGMDFTSLQVAVLYPFYSIDLFDKKDFEQRFDEDTRKLLDSVKEMEALLFVQNLDESSVNDAKVDKVRRMLLAMVDDIRVVVIKLCERIAVIREAKNADEKTKVLIAREVNQIYAPLANRLGIGQIKWELEDLSFRYLYPETYQRITKLLDEKRVDREKYIQDFVEMLKNLLEKEGIKAKVYGRPKHIYSIYRKMQRKHVEFNELYDVRAVRIVVDKVQDCYAALGVVHTKWHHIPKEFDDYIANPKPNGYQSIHTVVIATGNRPVEIQIRTQSMHNIAELGVAAHWRYKEGGSQLSGAEERINWLRKLFAWRDDAKESGVLLNEFRNKVFENRVYVFTPKGEVVDLPTGSTPLDFAYQVHTMVGHRCIGAKVDGRIVPYNYELKTGEQVEIITQKEPQPSRDWANPKLGFLKSAKARSKVLAWFRKVDYDKNLPAGIELLEKENERHSLGLSKEQWEGYLKENLKRFNVKSVDDLYAGLGNGDIKVSQVVHYLQEKILHKGEQEKKEYIGNIIANRQAAAVMEQQQGKGEIIVDGVDNLMSHIAKCCQPIPGDDITGFITQGRGISIHRSDCKQLHAIALQNPNRIIPARWGSKTEQGYTVTIRVIARDYSGLLRDITTVIANQKLNVIGLRSRTESNSDLSFVDIDLMIVNVNSLDKTLVALNGLDHVQTAKRI